VDFTLRYALKALVLPPGGLLMLLALAWLVGRRWRRLGWGLAVVAWTGLYVLSTPLAARWLAQRVETVPPVAIAALRASGADALVVLSAGRRRHALEYGDRDVIGSTSLERLRYAAHIHRATGLPLLITGGNPLDEGSPMAEIMAESLRGDLGLAPRWLETRSRNTYENAQYSREILREAGIDHIILVSHAYHMPRAIPVFEHVGFQVTPAPMGYQRGGGAHLRLLDMMPAAWAMESAFVTLHELLGRLWYRIEYGGPY
jgi:uncharacterized SAM-binding protein YcdF (DUF218 family)